MSASERTGFMHANPVATPAVAQAAIFRLLDLKLNRGRDAAGSDRGWLAPAPPGQPGSRVEVSGAVSAWPPVAVKAYTRLEALVYWGACGRAKAKAAGAGPSAAADYDVMTVTPITTRPAAVSLLLLVKSAASNVIAVT